MILPEYEAKKLLMEASAPVVEAIAVETLETAKAEAARIGGPVALKFSSARHAHKTEVGGVFLNLKDDCGLEEAFRKVEELRGRLDPDGKIILEAMAPRGTEFFIGFQRHPQFGPVLSFGMGGVWLELFHVVAFRLLPARGVDFLEMASELKGWDKLRAGFRNFPPVDENQVVDLLGRISALVLARPDIMEMDLNPVIAAASGMVVLDARIVMDGSNH